MTGLTLPGIMEEPFCIAGSVISPNPAFGPLARIRRSLHILDKLTAHAFMQEETRTNPYP